MSKLIIRRVSLVLLHLFDGLTFPPHLMFVLFTVVLRASGPLCCWRQLPNRSLPLLFPLFSLPFYFSLLAIPFLPFTLPFLTSLGLWGEPQLKGVRKCHPRDF